MIKTFLSPEGHQNPFIGSKVSAILLKGCLQEGLQPAQQACFYKVPFAHCQGKLKVNKGILLQLVAYFKHSPATVCNTACVFL